MLDPSGYIYGQGLAYMKSTFPSQNNQKVKLRDRKYLKVWTVKGEGFTPCGLNEGFWLMFLEGYDKRYLVGPKDRTAETL